MLVNSQTIIGDILKFDSTIAKCFLDVGMHCLGCPSARGETIEQACEVHEVDCEALVNEINLHLGN